MFLELVEKVALDHKVAVKKRNKKPEFRQIAYLDTSNFNFYKKGFILRLRSDLIGINHVTGRLKGKTEAELTLKFRSSDIESALIAPVKPETDYGDKVSCEEDVVIKATQPVSIFSSAGKATIMQPSPANLVEALKIFPGLRQIGLSGNPNLKAVNNKVIVEKSHSPIELYFNNEKTKAEFAVWHEKGAKAPFIAEFSFKLKIGDKLSSSEIKAREIIDRFFMDLVKRGKFFVDQGQTKTGAVYEFR
jgi:hypothetical protein